MDTTFYNSIFPSVGLRVLAVFKQGLKSPPSHSFYDSNDDLIEAASTYNTLGKNVYHGCAVYKSSDSRKGDNVLAIKSLWLDLDVGDTKPYASKQDAATHLEQFRLTLGLPLTHMVSSGGGIHAYSAFTKPILPEHWDRLAALFAACLDHYGVKHDTSRTQDKASILRIPGTHNYKSDPARSVKLLRLGVEASAADLFRLLDRYAKANGVVAAAAPAKGKPVVTNDLIGTPDYPPSTGDNVVQHCPTLAEVESSGGDVSYDIWWRAMGVAKHTTDPLAVAAHWTRHREATGHGKADHQGTIDGWAAGPTTCAEFAKHSTLCAGCPHNGKIKSPIQLGTTAQPSVAAIVPVVPPALLTPVRLPGLWTFGAQWIMDAKARATHTGFSSDGSVTMSVKQEDGTFKHEPFCNRYWQVMKRLRTVEGTWQLEIGYQQYPGRPHKIFLLDSAAVTAPDKLRNTFSTYELHVTGGIRGILKAQQMIMYEQSLLYKYEQETPIYPTMGWVSENNAMRGDLTGEFVLGDTVYRPKEPPQKILLADTVDVALRADFTAKGTVDEWVALVNRVYNRPQAEPYQFVIAAMFASPLVRLMPGGGEWHGIPITISGDSGAAKTTTALVGLSMYAPGQVLRFSAQGGKGGQGDTINALSIKMGSLRNLPFLMDEMSDAEASKVGDITYMQANGKSKDRMSTNGKMVPNPYRWDLISLITANESLHEVLKGLRSQNTQEATQLRTFEVWLSNDVKTLFRDIDRSTVEDDILARQYGMVGRSWIQFVVNNRIKISEKLALQRKEYKIDPEDSSSIRFYKDLLITVSVAAHLAKAKGFIHWDVDRMIRWAESQLIVLRDRITARDWEGTISDFIASLHGRTIITRHLKLGPGRRSSTQEMPMEPLSTVQLPVARKATDDKMFVVTANALKQWSQENRIMPSTLVAEMLQRGYLTAVPGKKAEARLINIGSGTTVARPQAPCYELVYDRVIHYSTYDAAPGGAASSAANVVAFPTTTASVTDVVTATSSMPPDSAVSP